MAPTRYFVGLLFLLFLFVKGVGLECVNIVHQKGSFYRIKYFLKSRECVNNGIPILFVLYLLSNDLDQGGKLIISLKKSARFTKIAENIIIFAMFDFFLFLLLFFDK